VNEVLQIGGIETGDTMQTDVFCEPNENGSKEAP